jgi:hypothetical protein
MKVLWLFEPLIEAGIISFARSQQHWCPGCVQLAEERGTLDEFVGVPESEWQQRVARTTRLLMRQYRREVAVTLRSEDGTPRIVLSGPDRLVPHGRLSFRYTKGLSEDVVREASLRPVRLDQSQIDRTKAYHSNIMDIIDDLSTQRHYSRKTGCDYLTTREIDLDLIRSTSSPPVKAVNEALLESFTHALPFVQEVPIENILNLRRREAESFEVYRDAVRGLLQGIDLRDPAKIKQAFADVVRPEVNRLNLTIKNSRKAMAIPAAASVVVAAGAMSVAVMSGLVSGVAGITSAVLAAGGGVAGITALAGKVHKAATPPQGSSDQRFFFLWKVLKAAKRA